MNRGAALKKQRPFLLARKAILMARLKKFAYEVPLALALIMPLTRLAHSATPQATSPERRDPAAAFVSDQPPGGTPEAVEVAREVLRLQEELGGSIVSDLGMPEPTAPTPWTLSHALPSLPQPPQPNWVPRQPTPVDVLRETAWQLEQSAHLLESLDLYAQADALRTTATQLRQDARKLKSEQKQEDSAAVRAN